MRLMIAAVLVLALCGAARERDPMAGSWEADLRASRFVVGFPALRSQSMICLARDGGVGCSIERVTAAGVRSTARFSADYDGRTYPVAGIPDMDGVALRREAAGVVAVFFHRTQPLFAYRITASPDGRRLTIRSIDPRTKHDLYSIVRYRRV